MLEFSCIFRFPRAPLRTRTGSLSHGCSEEVREIRLREWGIVDYDFKCVHEIAIFERSKSISPAWCLKNTMSSLQKKKKKESKMPDSGMVDVWSMRGIRTVTVTDDV